MQEEESCQQGKAGKRTVDPTPSRGARFPSTAAGPSALVASPQNWDGGWGQIVSRQKASSFNPKQSPVKKHQLSFKDRPSLVHFNYSG